MQLNNASIENGIRNFARRFANADSNSYPNPEIDASINRYYQTIVNEAIKSNDSWDFQGERATADLVADQKEYTFPTDLIKVKRVEITYDGTNWYKCRIFDIETRDGSLDDTTVNKDFTTTDPYVDLYDNSMFIYPIPSAAVTGGLKIWYQKEITELSADTDEPSIQESFHIGLAYGAAKDYLEQNLDVKGNKNRLAMANSNYESVVRDLHQYYRRRVTGEDYTIEPRNIDYDYGYR